MPLQAPGSEYVGGATDPSLAEPPAPAHLTEEQADGLVAWAERVARFYHPSIAVAMRRTLSAVAERRSSAEDTLRDAVIEWENLFGTGGTSEMTFRVTTALALLLDPDPASRPALRKELSKVYDLRSKVAHGGEVKPKDQLAAKGPSYRCCHRSSTGALRDAHFTSQRAGTRDALDPRVAREGLMASPGRIWGWIKRSSGQTRERPCYATRDSGVCTSVHTHPSAYSWSRPQKARDPLN